MFCNKYKGILVIEYYNRLETQLDFDHEIKNAKEKEWQILGITIPFIGQLSISVIDFSYLYTTIETKMSTEVNNFIDSTKILF